MDDNAGQDVAVRGSVFVPFAGGERCGVLARGRTPLPPPHDAHSRASHNNTTATATAAEMQAGDRAAVHDAMGQLRSGAKVDDAVRSAWAAFVSAPTRGGWLMLTPHAVRKAEVTLAATGEGGYSEAHAALLERPGDIAFVICAFAAAGQRKAFFLTWVGPSVSPLKRGKVSLQKNGASRSSAGGAEVWAAAAVAATKGVALPRCAQSPRRRRAARTATPRPRFSVPCHPTRRGGRSIGTPLPTARDCRFPPSTASAHPAHPPQLCTHRSMGSPPTSTSPIRGTPRRMQCAHGSARRSLPWSCRRAPRRASREGLRVARLLTMRALISKQ